MKKIKLLYVVLMLLPLAITLAVLPQLPEQIPAHYNAANEVTRWGSKYETLVLPGLSILFGGILLGVARWSGKQKEGGAATERTCLWVGMGCLGLFLVMNVYFLYTAFRQVENLNQMPLELSSLTWGALALVLLSSGLWMPKLKRSHVIGLRTKQSMSDDEAWHISQKTGSRVLTAGGAAILLVCLLTDGVLCTVLSLVLLLASAAGAAIAAGLAVEKR